MRTPRIPDIWRDLRPGEQFHSRLPFHRLQLMAEQLPDRRFAFLPAASGYWVKCEGISETKPDDAPVH